MGGEESSPGKLIWRLSRNFDFEPKLRRVVVIEETIQYT